MDRASVLLEPLQLFSAQGDELVDECLFFFGQGPLFGEVVNYRLLAHNPGVPYLV